MATMQEPERQFEIDIQDETVLESVARAFADAGNSQFVIGLVGTLGAGKTRFTQALVDGLGGATNQVVSPTFTVCNEYRFDGCAVDHLDLYRIADDDELDELGLEEYFDAPAVTVVEWCDRFPDAMPDDRLELNLEITGPNSRRAMVSLYGDQYAEIFEAVVRRFGG